LHKAKPDVVDRTDERFRHDVRTGDFNPVLSGANIAVIAGLHGKMIFSFHAQPDVQSPAQLRGEAVPKIGLYILIGIAARFGARILSPAEVSDRCNLSNWRCYRCSGRFARKSSGVRLAQVNLRRLRCV